MQASRLSERITIRAKSSGRDPLTGAEVPVWSDMKTLWAAADPIGGREYAQLAQSEYEADVRFTCHWDEVKHITTDSRVVWRGVTYDITRPVMDIGSRRRYGEILCKTNPNG